jgi:hypothetical protein
MKQRKRSGKRKNRKEEGKNKKEKGTKKKGKRRKKKKKRAVPYSMYINPHVFISSLISSPSPSTTPHLPLHFNFYTS